MSEPIKVGDLVRVIALMPCGHGRVGSIFTVGGLAYAAGRCGYCATYYQAEPCALVLPAEALCPKEAIELRRLRRIPPLWELDEVERKEELPA